MTFINTLNTTEKPIISQNDNIINAPIKKIYSPKILVHSQTEQEKLGVRFFKFSEVEKFIKKEFAGNDSKIKNIIELLQKYKKEYFEQDITSTNWSAAQVVNALIGNIAFSGENSPNQLHLADLEKFKKLDPKANAIIPDLLNTSRIAIDYNQGVNGLHSDHGNIIEKCFPKLDGVVIPFKQKSDSAVEILNDFQKSYAWLNDLVEFRNKHHAPPLTVSISTFPPFLGKATGQNLDASSTPALDFLKTEYGLNLSSLDCNKITPEQRQVLFSQLIKSLPKDQRVPALAYFKEIAKLIENPGVRQINLAAGNDGKEGFNLLNLIFGGHKKVHIIGALDRQGKIADYSGLAEYYASGTVRITTPLDSLPFAGDKYDKIKTNQTLLGEINNLLKQINIETDTSKKAALKKNLKALLDGKTIIASNQDLEKFPYIKQAFGQLTGASKKYYFLPQENYVYPIIDGVKAEDAYGIDPSGTLFGYSRGTSFAAPSFPNRSSGADNLDIEQFRQFLEKFSATP